MRFKEVWDDWMLKDEHGFDCGIRPDAPDDVKKAYEQYVAKLEAIKASGQRIPKV